jgi:hypothetical protein
MDPAAIRVPVNSMMSDNSRPSTPAPFHRVFQGRLLDVRVVMTVKTGGGPVKRRRHS